MIPLLVVLHFKISWTLEQLKNNFDQFLGIPFDLNIVCHPSTKSWKFLIDHLINFNKVD